MRREVRIARERRSSVHCATCANECYDGWVAVQSADRPFDVSCLTIHERCLYDLCAVQDEDWNVFLSSRPLVELFHERHGVWLADSDLAPLLATIFPGRSVRSEPADS